MTSKLFALAACMGLVSTCLGQSPALPVQAFAPDDKTVAKTEGSSIAILDAATSKTLQIMKGHTEDVTALAFTPDSKRLASGAKDKSIVVWDVATGRMLFKLSGPTSPVRTIVFARDGSELFATEDNGTLWLIDGRTGKVNRKVEKP